METKHWHWQVPGPLRPVYRWMNYRASSGNNWDNPLWHVRANAHPDDYVLLKLDVDNTPVSRACDLDQKLEN
jgi:hypothetical protein